LRAVLGLLADLAGRGVSVSPLAKSWTNAAKLLPLEAGYPAGLDAAGLNDILADAEAGGMLVREKYSNAQRKARMRWALSEAGMTFIGRRAAPVADAHDAEAGARASSAVPEEDPAPVAAPVALGNQRTPAQAASYSPLMTCMQALEVALDEGGMAPTAAVIEACYGCEPEVVVGRDAWLEAWVSMRGDGSAASIEEFGRAMRELLNLGVVRVARGGLVWVVS
jgi:hypothetical protein